VHGVIDYTVNWDCVTPRAGREQVHSPASAAVFHRPSQVRVLADPHGELARGLGLELEAKAMLGTNRSKRYSAVIQDNEIKALNVEPDGTGDRACI
jgi:peroxiredoxin